MIVCGSKCHNFSPDQGRGHGFLSMGARSRGGLLSFVLKGPPSFSGLHFVGHLGSFFISKGQLLAYVDRLGTSFISKGATTCVI